MLEISTKIKGDSDSKSLVVRIPSWMALDSQFPFKAGQEIKLIVRKNHIDIYAEK